jgi:succinate dehydrogenase / fumarate reductase cytochrome b subunit
MNKEKPTSPHLQIYRWSLSSITSITHRLTGVILYFSVILISWYITYYAYQINIMNPSESCDCPFKKIFDIIFYLASIFVVFALYYHFCNGIRHLFWDIGKGFDKEAATRSAVLVIVISLLLTIVTVLTTIYIKLF